MNYKIITTGLRSIWKDKILSAVLIVGLTVGITSLTLIAVFLDFNYSFDKYHEDSDRIYRIVSSYKDKGEISELTPAKFSTSLRNVPGIYGTTKLFRLKTIEVKVGDNQFKIEKPFFADSGFFKVFTYKITSGKNTALLKNPFEAVITESCALKIWGNKDVAGNVFLFNGNDYVIKGVMEDVPVNSHFRFDILLSFSSWQSLFDQFSNEFYTYFRIDKNADANIVLNTAMSECKADQQTDSQKNIKKAGIIFQPLLDIYLNSSTFQYKIADYGSKSLVEDLLLIALCLFVILVLNFSGMLSVKFLKRFKELGIRKVLGANRFNLVMQILTESFVITTIISALSLMTVFFVIKPFGSIFNADLPLLFVNIYKIILFIFFLCLSIGIVSSVIPSYKIIMSTKPAAVFADTRSPKKKKLMFSIVVVQLAVVSGLVPVLLIMLSQVHYLNNKNTGFNKEDIIYFENHSRVNPVTIINELEKINGVKSATASDTYPGQVHSGMTLCRFGADKSNTFLAFENRVQKDFIPTYGLKLIAGRVFSGTNEDEKDNIILNETAVKKLDYTPQTIINEKVVHFLGVKKVIGVIKDYNFMSLHSKIDPLILSNYSKGVYIYSLLIDPLKYKDITRRVEDKIKSIDQNFKVEFNFLNDDLRQLYKHDENEATMVFVGTIICIVLALVGLIALTSFTLLQRTKEVGIRKVFGASVPEILSVLYKDYVKMVVAANILIIPVTLNFISGWLNNYPFHIQADVKYFIGGGLIVLFLTVISVFYFVIKAAFRNPINIIRYE